MVLLLVLVLVTTVFPSQGVSTEAPAEVPAEVPAEIYKYTVEELLSHYAAIWIGPEGATEKMEMKEIIHMYVNGINDWKASSSVNERDAALEVINQPWPEFIETISTNTANKRTTSAVLIDPIRIGTKDIAPDELRGVLVSSVTDGSVQKMTESLNESLGNPIPKESVKNTNVYIYHLTQDYYYLVESLSPATGCVVLKITNKIKMSHMFPQDADFTVDFEGQKKMQLNNNSHDRDILRSGKYFSIDFSRKSPAANEVGSIQHPRSDQFGHLAGQQILSGVGFNDLWGEVMVWDDDDWGDAWHAELHGKIYVHSVIVTGPRSGAILSLRDGTTFVMGPNSMVTVSDERDENGRLGILVGHVMTNVKQMLQDGSMDIEMSVAMAGARGTIFVVEETGEASTLKVLEGTVEFKTIRDETYILESGQMITATKDATSSVGGFSIAEELKNWPEKIEEETRVALLEKGIVVEDQQGKKKGITFIIILIIAAGIGGFIFYNKKLKAQLSR